MTLDATLFGRRPIRLFVFTRATDAGTKVWRYCNSDRDLTIGGNTYTAAQIDRSEIKQTSERAKDKITITMAYLRNPGAPEFPATQDLGDQYFPFVPSSTITVICMTTHAGEADPPAVEWMGQVTQPKFTDVELELTCEPTGSNDRARNQGAKWQRACWKTVYSTGLRGCNLDPADFQITATLAAVSGLSLSAAAFSGGTLTLAGGSLSLVNGDGLTERRQIMTHTDSTITLLYGSPDIAIGLAVTALPGCERTWAACSARGNTLNYGGSVYKPVKNPTGESMSWG